MASKNQILHTREDKILFIRKYREGSSARTVAKAAGVSENTVLRWHKALAEIEQKQMKVRRRQSYIELRDGAGRALRPSILDLSERLDRIEAWIDRASAPV